MNTVQFTGLVLIALGAFWLLLGYLRFRILERRMWQDFRDAFEWSDHDERIRIIGGIHDHEKDEWKPTGNG